MQQTHKRTKLVEFEGLRGIAAVCVLYGHMLCTFAPDADSKFESSIRFIPQVLRIILRNIFSAMHDANFAVWIFWVMSAFVLSMRSFTLERSGPDGNHYLSEAAIRRYPRLLLPVLASVGVGYAIARLGLMRNLELGRLFGGEREALLSAYYRFDPSLFLAVKSAVWDTFFAYSIDKTYNAVLWTMEKELWGSLFIFVFLALLRHTKVRIVAYVGLVVIIAVLKIHWLNAFVIGMALCDFHVNRDLIKPHSAIRWVANGGYLFLQSVWSVVIVIPVFLVIVGAYGGQISRLLQASTLCFLVLYQPHLREFFSSKIPRYLGKISFGLYLVHFPIICSFTCWFYLQTYHQLGHVYAALLGCLITSVMSIISGHLLYLIADKPSIPFSKILARPFTSMIRRWTPSKNMEVA